MGKSLYQKSDEEATCEIEHHMTMDFLTIYVMNLIIPWECPNGNSILKCGFCRD